MPRNSSCPVRARIRGPLGICLILAAFLLACARDGAGDPEVEDAIPAGARSDGNGAAPGAVGTAGPMSAAELDSPLALANLAASLAAADRPAEAEEVLLRALELSPDSPALLAEVSRLRLALGRDAEALGPAVRAADLSGGADARLYLLATSARLRLGQSGEAAADLARWEREHGVSPLLGVARGLVHENAGRREEAAALYAAALRADPGCREALSGIVKLSFERGDPGAALAAIRRAEAAGAAPRIWEGQALRRLGRLEEAEAAYRAALTLEPDHVVALADLGALRAVRGDYAGARTLLARAIELRPDLTGARANLDEVDRRLSESGSPPAPAPSGTLPAGSD